MKLAVRVAGLLTVGVAVAIVAWALDADLTVRDLAIIAAALAAGELATLRPADRAPLPLSFAVVTVLVVAATPAEFIVIVVAAEAVAMCLLVEPLGLNDRLMRFAERCAEAFAAGAIYQTVDTIHPWGERATALVALTAAAVVPIVVADLVTYVREQRFAALRPCVVLT